MSALSPLAAGGAELAAAPTGSCPGRPTPADREIPMAQLTADDRTKAFQRAIGSMTLPVAAVIVHGETDGRVVLLQRGERAKFAKGRSDFPSGRNEPKEPSTATTVREL
ncbi:hypothetical protein SUDANB180_04396 [Streptomyces sp. enrichment culture]